MTLAASISLCSPKHNLIISGAAAAAFVIFLVEILRPRTSQQCIHGASVDSAQLTAHSNRVLPFPQPPDVIGVHAHTTYCYVTAVVQGTVLAIRMIVFFGGVHVTWQDSEHYMAADAIHLRQ